MSAPRLRRRALTITAALAGTVGLALGGIAPANAAAPVAAAPAAAPAQSATASSRALDALHNTDFGTPASRAAVAQALNGTAAGSSTLPSSSLQRSATTDAVRPAPAGAIPAAKVDPNAAAGGGFAQAVLGDELYGVSFDWNGGETSLERWTKFGWKPVAGAPEDLDDQVVVVGNRLYITVTTYSRSGNATVNLMSYDGTTFTSVKTFKNDVTLAVAGSYLTIVEDAGEYGEDSYSEKSILTRYDGTTFSTPIETTKSLDDSIAIGDTQYFLVLSRTSSAAAIYRVDAAGLTRIGSSPYALSGAEWKGAYYFGGVSGNSDAAALYRFDGKGAPTPVTTGVSFKNAISVPAVGVYDGELEFTNQTKGKRATLYSFDGTTTSSDGPIGGSGEQIGFFQEFDSKLFYAAYDYEDGISTYIYDKNAKAGTPIESTVPTVAGTPKVGKKLTAVPGDWTATAKLSYQWSVDGKAIAGATKQYHTVAPAELRRTLTVKVSGSGPAFVTATQTSASTAAALPGTFALKPVISGKTVVGSKLTAVTSGLTPKSATLTYRWLRDGKPISGATKKTHTASKGDVGTSLTVSVKASSPGYSTASATSAAKKVTTKK
ncbi:hypothetical protein [Frondihabitans sp. Leaf304]|uniref:hypothetical protein n=1 Tax=Frondihabitans sp. Leaf304 TaxID=1736329 RepID=UPI0006F45F85|nr:hypothetical protein [Frondihabitans sp. Leaf304]KQQ26849.1 hypothetical protein ASF54_12950 [Frondihabitans sp. Leaf304]